MLFQVPTKTPCIGGLDIGSVLDKSRSLGLDDLDRLLTFVGDLVDKFHPSTLGDHFGLITFGRNATLVFSFADSQYYDKVKQELPYISSARDV